MLLVAAAVAVFASPAAAADAPLATPADFEVMLVVDTSGSMAGTPIDVARNAAVSFVTQMPSDVRIGAESFGREIKVLSAPTLDHMAVAQQLGALTTGGDTPLHDAVITATRSFTPAARYKAIVLLSDGGDKNSVASLDEAVAAVSGIHVEAVSLTTPKTDLGALTRLGTVTPAEDPAALPAVLGRLAALLIPATVEAAPAPTTGRANDRPSHDRPAHDHRTHDHRTDDVRAGADQRRRRVARPASQVPDRNEDRCRIGRRCAAPRRNRRPGRSGHRRHAEA